MGEPATLEVGMTEADFSNKELGMGGAIIISAWITHKDKGALSMLSLKENELYAEGGKALAAGLKGNQGITELDISSNMLGWKGYEDPDMSGVIALANALPDMRALLVLNLAANGFTRAEAGKALGDAIAANTALKELDISGGEYSHTRCDVEFVQTISAGLRDNGAMTSLNLAENYMGDDGAKHIAAAIKVIHCVLALILTLFSCPSDYLFNCWCLLLSAEYEGNIVNKSSQE
jgi:hypothetical protein